MPASVIWYMYFYWRASRTVIRLPSIQFIRVRSSGFRLLQNPKRISIYREPWIRRMWSGYRASASWPGTRTPCIRSIGDIGGGGRTRVPSRFGFWAYKTPFEPINLIFIRKIIEIGGLWNDCFQRRIKLPIKGWEYLSGSSFFGTQEVRSHSYQNQKLRFCFSVAILYTEIFEHISTLFRNKGTLS